MHDEHRLKDRIELSLDNRQIFLLFVASAVVVALVFALGVVVGKRMTPNVAAKAPTDPLALLDQLGKQAQDDDLTFPDKLSRKGAGAGSGSGSGSAASADAGASPPAAPTAPSSPSTPAQPATRLAAKGKDTAKSKAKSKGKTAGKRAVAAKAKSRASKRKRLGYRPLPQKLPRRVALAKARKRAGKAAKGGKSKGEDGKTKGPAPGTYTLQLSSFQDRSEAEQFMKKLQAKGLVPHMIPTRIAGRGIFYRVRLGSYTSWDEAMKAKRTYEQTQQVIAYVARN